MRLRTDRRVQCASCEVVALARPLLRSALALCTVCTAVRQRLHGLRGDVCALFRELCTHVLPPHVMSASTGASGHRAAHGMVALCLCAPLSRQRHCLLAARARDHGQSACSQARYVRKNCAAGALRVRALRPPVVFLPLPSRRSSLVSCVPLSNKILKTRPRKSRFFGPTSPSSPPHDCVPGGRGCGGRARLFSCLDVDFWTV